MVDSRTRAPRPDPDPIDAAAQVLSRAGVRAAQRVCVALSGGLDSVVLLDLMQRLQERFGYVLSAAHVHHGISPNADAWSEFCADLCARRGIGFHALAVTVPECADEGFEAAARKLRHGVLRRLPADWLAYGHHREDQAETLLFRLLRGCGVRGAAAMAAYETGAPGRLRPLLAVPRNAIRACAHARGLEWIEDESNLDRKHARNWLRHEILPRIETSFPGAARTLGRAAALFRETEGLLEDLARIDRAACGGDSLSRVALLGLPEARLRNLLRHEIARAGAESPSHEHLSEVVRQLTQIGGRPLRFRLGRLACCVYRDRFWLEPFEIRSGQPVRWAGEAQLCWGDGTVRFESQNGSGVATDRLMGQPVSLVPRWPGLVMRVHADRPTRTFKNLCQEAGVPEWLRDRLPVLQVGTEAIWIGGIGLAADWACPVGAGGMLPRWMPGEHGWISDSRCGA